MTKQIEANVEYITSRESYTYPRKLHAYYLKLLAQPADFKQVPSLYHSSILSIASILDMEKCWDDYELARIKDYSLPSTAAQFENWYFSWVNKHKEATSNLFEYLAKEADLTDMSIFFVAEEKVDSKFDDLMALAQLGAPNPVKLIIAKNYWDEMGDGHPELIHTALFDKSVKFMKEHLKSVGIDPNDIDFEEIYSNATILLMYGVRRWFVPRLIGALGILEETASQRFQAMVDGCNRLGVPKNVIHYQDMHVSLDHDHGREWFDGVLKPLIHQSKDLMEEVCKGVLIRHNIAVEYYSKLYDFVKQKQYQQVFKN